MLKKDLKKRAKLESKEDKKGEVSKKDTTTEVKAALNYLPMAPRKVRLVTNLLVNKDVSDALNLLVFINKMAARPVAKLIKSAIANAENNFKFDKNNLFIKKIVVNSGPMLKRWFPRAYGRAALIRKRTSHISLILGLKKEVKKMASLAKTEMAKGKEKIKTVNLTDIKKESKKEEVKLRREPEISKGSDKGFVKKIFSRKIGV